MKKNNQLVCQHLEGISRDALEKYHGIIRQFVKGRHGIYALYEGRRLYYVGLTSDLRFRLKQHLRDRHGDSWDRFSVYLTLEDSPLRELESLIVRIAKPAGNRQSGQFVRSENLRRRFTHDVKSLQRNELSAIIGEQNLDTGQARWDMADGKEPILAQYTKNPVTLQAKFKGKIVKARVRKDGSVVFGSKIFNSPSSAAAAACCRSTCNGWTFWSYERAPGNWIKLDNLRKV